MNYVAIDFETAACRMDSACALGLVRFDCEGEELDSWYSLIRPPVLQFDDVCTQVHHLSPIDISKAPTLLELWPEIKGFIKNDPLVAHNAQFDMNVLRHTLSAWGLEVPPYKYFCTLSLSRKLWKGKRSYKLTSLAEELGWEYDAHNALADAEICGRLFSRLCGEALFNDNVASRFFSRIYKKGEKHVFPETLTSPYKGTLFG
ncbi:MAG: 3'-5' exonuclease [Candidatus Ornithospirochaeta sp.]